VAERRVSASRFKAECIRLLDEIDQTGTSIVVTKRGRPVARVEPVRAPATLRGSVTYPEGADALGPVLDAWDAETR